ncbi:hypothetical protein CW304_21270 [Bacillus sp. UFRGS-B20]|nr:hypothetical protein CW304_21270 [Bacillus sp. UFRGS-B20]
MLLILFFRILSTCFFARFVFLLFRIRMYFRDFHINNAILGNTVYFFCFICFFVFVWTFRCDVSILISLSGIHLELGTSSPLGM